MTKRKLDNAEAFDEAIALLREISTNLNELIALWQEVIARCEQDMTDNP